ncbi:hypothetical protein TRVA0_031S01068 [Trichomonascus vanleenenianus]|uniref:uncharacterized protein n=1 Tax=Trichomonascus vanleenenianus TaxID=2268995 RepID=UPI003ECB5975
MVLYMFGNFPPLDFTRLTLYAMATVYYNVRLWEYLSNKIQDDSDKIVLVYIGTEYDLFKEIEGKITSESLSSSQITVVTVSSVKQAVEYLIKRNSSMNKCCIWGVVKSMQQVPKQPDGSDEAPQEHYVTDYVRVLGIISSSSTENTKVELGGRINGSELIQLTKDSSKRISLRECLSKWYHIVDKVA